MVRYKNGSCWPFCLCGNMQEIGLLEEARGKRCHTILSKLQRKGFLVLKRYRDAKNNIFSSNSVKRCLFKEGK